MSEVLTEGRVSKTILSFGKEDFLFTGTVCRSWRENSASAETGAKASVESRSRVAETLTNQMLNDTYEKCIHKALNFALHNDADLSVLEELYIRRCCTWENMIIQFLAQYGRADVIEFLTKNGIVLDAKVLHVAVHYDRLNVVQHLLKHNCPVDKELIKKSDWQSGRHVRHNFEMRSLEMAISHQNLEMIKTLRTVDYPFIADTFRVACETKNLEIMKYLHEEGCTPDESLFFDSHEIDDTFSLEFFCENGYFRDEWEDILPSSVLYGHEKLTNFLLGEGIVPTDDVVDCAICAGNMQLAFFLTKRYTCRPTAVAYTDMFETELCDCTYLHCLRWLYYDMECSIGFTSFKEMQDDQSGAYVLSTASDMIKDWFKERLV